MIVLWTNIQQVIVIRDFSYSLPSVLPPEWLPVEHILRSPDQLIWMAEYNSACIKALKKRVGIPDNARKVAKAILQERPELGEKLQQGTLDVIQDYDSLSSLILYATELRISLTRV